MTWPADAKNRSAKPMAVVAHEHAHVGRAGRQEMRMRLEASGYAVRDCCMGDFAIKRELLKELGHRPRRPAVR